MKLPKGTDKKPTLEEHRKPLTVSEDAVGKCERCGYDDCPCEFDQLPSKTIEDIALELYPKRPYAASNNGQPCINDLNEPIRQAYIKGYQLRCLEEIKERGE